MKEEEFRGLLGRYLEGEATPAEKQRVLEAVRNSEDLNRILIQSVQMEASLKALRHEGEPFRRKVLNDVMRRESKDRFVKRVRARLQDLSTAGGGARARENGDLEKGGPGVNTGLSASAERGREHAGRTTRASRRTGRSGARRARNSNTSFPLAACIAASLLLLFSGYWFLGAVTTKRPEEARKKKPARERFKPGQTHQPAECERLKKDPPELEHAHREPTETGRQAVAQPLPGTVISTPEQQQARLDDERRKAAEEEQERLQAEEREAEQTLARAEQKRREAEGEKAVRVSREAQEVGEIVYVTEFKGDAAARPVRVRGEGEDATRAPLARGMKLCVGDQIETGARATDGRSADQKSKVKSSDAQDEIDAHLARPVRAAVNLWGGATVDLADETRFEVLGYESSRLEEGLIYAQVEEPAGAEPELVFKTEFANVQMLAKGSFELSVDARRARLRVERGPASYADARGRGKQRVLAMRESVAPRGAMPRAPVRFAGGVLWRGRAAPEGPRVLYRFREGRGRIVRDLSGADRPLPLEIQDPTAVQWIRGGGLAVRKPTVIQSSGSATEVIEACRRSNELSVEILVRPRVEGLSKLPEWRTRRPFRIVELAPDGKSQVTTTPFTFGMGMVDGPVGAFEFRLLTNRDRQELDRVSTLPEGAITSPLVHLIYARDTSGVERFCLNGKGHRPMKTDYRGRGERGSQFPLLPGTGLISGDFSGWPRHARLTVANRLDQGRPWLGEIYLVAIYARALSVSEAHRLFRARMRSGR